MNSHFDPNSIILDHPIIRTFIRKVRRSRSAVLKRILPERVGFLYPKTLVIVAPTFEEEIWPLKELSADKALQTIISAINELSIQGKIKHVVLDFREWTDDSTLHLDLWTEMSALMNKTRVRFLLLAKHHFLPFLKDIHFDGRDVEVYDDVKALSGELRKNAADSRCIMKFRSDLQESNIENHLRDLVRKVDTQAETLVFDFSNVIKTDFNSICLLVIFLHSLAHKLGCLFDIVLPKRKRPRQYLAKLRFESICASFLSESSVIEMLRMANKSSYDSYGIVELTRQETESLTHFQMGSEIPRLLAPFQEYVLKYLSQRHRVEGDRSAGIGKWQDFITLFHELLDNGTRHSGSTVYFALEASLDNRVLHAFVGDIGIGLRKGINRNYKKSIGATSDAKSIQLCFQLYEKQKLRKRDVHDGFGFNNMREVLEPLRGQFRVRSGNAYGYFRNLKNIKPKLSRVTTLDGSQFFVTIPLFYPSQTGS